MIRMRDYIPEEDMPPRRRFVLTAPPPGCDVAEKFLFDARTDRRDIRLEIDVVRGQRTAYETELQRVRQRQGPELRIWQVRTDDARTRVVVWKWISSKPMLTQWGSCYVEGSQEGEEAWKASEHMMMTSIEEVNLRVSYQAQVRRRESEDFYTQLHDAQTDRRDIRLEIDGVRGQRTAYETKLHERQAVEDRAVRQMMCTHVLEAKAQIDTVEDTGSSWTLKKKLTDKYYPKGEIKKLEIKLWNLKTEKVDKYISGLPDNIHENVMSARPKTFDDAIELANDLMDQKLHTYAERQNDNKRKADDSSRNNQQQQPYNNQNIARAYTAGPGEKKAYTGNLPLCTKCNYHHTGQCAPKCGNCKRYGHTTNDCRVNTNKNNNNKNQKAGACYECGNTGHIKKNCPKLKRTVRMATGMT
ncbi:putative reverse transcriptase domain-containing protein [Tanacetum coccineum]